MRAIGNIQRGIMAGKLKGAMPAHTPNGVLHTASYNGRFSATATSQSN